MVKEETRGKFSVRDTSDSSSSPSLLVLKVLGEISLAETFWINR